MTKPRPLDITEELITEILDSINSLVEAHKGYAQFGGIEGNKVVIFCGGQCTDCENKCIEDAIKDKFPDVEVVFR